MVLLSWQHTSSYSNLSLLWVSMWMTTKAPWVLIWRSYINFSEWMNLQIQNPQIMRVGYTLNNLVSSHHLELKEESKKENQILVRHCLCESVDKAATLALQELIQIKENTLNPFQWLPPGWGKTRGGNKESANKERQQGQELSVINSLLSASALPFAPPSLPALLSQLPRRPGIPTLVHQLNNSPQLSDQLHFMDFSKRIWGHCLLRLNVFAEITKICIYEWEN